MTKTAEVELKSDECKPLPIAPSRAVHAAAKAAHAALSGAPPPSFIPSAVPPAADHSSGVAISTRSSGQPSNARHVIQTHEGLKRGG